MADPRNLPLFAFGEALRAARARRRRLRRHGLALALGLAALGLTIAVPPRPWLLWNASASAPLGLYRITAPGTPAPGDLVAVWLPAAARDLATRRRYLPHNVPALKRVAAVTGTRICAQGSTLLIAGRAVAKRLATDRQSRPLPRWHGCQTLRSSELLLLNPASATSFDGRYFGASRTRDVIGKAQPLWTWRAGAGA